MTQSTQESGADAFAWLRADGDNPDVAAFDARQHAVTDAYIQSWPHVDELTALLHRHGLLGRSLVPRGAGSRWFRIAPAVDGGPDVVIVADEAFGDGRVVLDSLNTESGQRHHISWIAPSPDGETLAVGVCLPGSEQNRMRLIRVEDGTELADPPAEVLADSWTAGVQWLDRARLVFHTPAGAFLHERTPAGGTTSPLSVPWPREGELGFVIASRDGRFLTAYQGTTAPLPVAIGRVGGQEIDWRLLPLDVDGTVIGHVIGERLVALTDVDAPRGRVVAIDLASDTPEDPTRWVDLVSESARVLRGIHPVGDNLYVSALEDTYSWLGVLEPGGGLVEVELPGRGAIHASGPFPAMQLLPTGHPDQLVFMFSTFAAHSGIYRHVPGSAGIDCLRRPIGLDVDVVVEDRCAKSLDGTMVPYQLVARADLDLTTVNPTMIFGYGGFNVALPNLLPDGTAAFIESRGIYVHAHLRGGGEYGPEWWHGARMKTKQTSYDDLFAIAEDLIASGCTSSDLLSVMGGSHGGLLAGVAVTQRPELWAAAAVRVPQLDLIGSCEDPYGRMVIAAEFADPDKPDEVARLAAISPYHLIQEGRAYPAVYVQAGAVDHRCPPWQSRTFAARLQESTTADRPILLRIWEDAGHGLASGRDTLFAQNLEWLAFLMKRLGMRPATSAEVGDTAGHARSGLSA